ncbi:RidA family protein [Porphyromonadaceae bacterium]
MKKIISSPNAPAAIGPYSQAVEINGLIYLSGQLPVDPTTGEIVRGGVSEQTKQIFQNIKAILSEVGCTTSNIVKTTVFLSDMSLFGEMNAVYAEQFDGDFPARSTIAVKGLPKNALVEIEAVVAK